MTAPDPSSASEGEVQSNARLRAIVWRRAHSCWNKPRIFQSCSLVRVSQILPEFGQLQKNSDVRIFHQENIIPTLGFRVYRKFKQRPLKLRFCNDATDAPTCPPTLLLKVIVFIYPSGLVSSRQIERARQEKVVFIALPKGSAKGSILKIRTISAFMQARTSRWNFEVDLARD